MVMSFSQHSLSLNNLEGLGSEDITQAVSDWLEKNSVPEAKAQIDADALDQIKEYEARYQKTSYEMKLLAESREFFDPEIGFWLDLIDLYPECLEVNCVGELNIA